MRRALLASLLLHALLLWGLATALSLPPAGPPALLISLQPAPVSAYAHQPRASPGTPARPAAPKPDHGGRAAQVARAANPVAAQDAAVSTATAPVPVAVPLSTSPAPALPAGAAAPLTPGGQSPARGEAGSQEAASSRPARVLQAPRPDYPVISRDLGEQGVVMLRLAIDADGRLQRTELQKSSGFTRLDKAARDSVARWQFQAALENGRPVAAQLVLPVRFSLDEN
ncbi:energy transducer TonB [Vogesella sp. XCS3]|uniref:energy transducer TonB n=1 Tax=Vogesella sp. XCS3 TaxID=2877939 RepID=UPI001D0AB0BC|nr:energy transducer TonB [Vogesella sp. XCS3]UDM15668.1 TonB family protein [Vogesella sp. XCS3]